MFLIYPIFYLIQRCCIHITVPTLGYLEPPGIIISIGVLPISGTRRKEVKLRVEISRPQCIVVYVDIAIEIDMTNTDIIMYTCVYIYIHIYIYTS